MTCIICIQQTPLRLPLGLSKSEMCDSNTQLQKAFVNAFWVLIALRVFASKSRYQFAFVQGQALAQVNLLLS